jgi:hypothetical protein
MENSLNLHTCFIIRAHYLTDYVDLGKNVVDLVDLIYMTCLGILSMSRNHITLFSLENQ